MMGGGLYAGRQLEGVYTGLTGGCMQVGSWRGNIHRIDGGGGCMQVGSWKGNIQD